MSKLCVVDNEGFKIEILAYDSETNIALIDRSQTGAVEPFVVVRDFDAENVCWHSGVYFKDVKDGYARFREDVFHARNSFETYKELFYRLLDKEFNDFEFTNETKTVLFEMYIDNDDVTTLMNEDVFNQCMEYIEELNENK